MLSPARSGPALQQVQLQQVRFISRRRTAYPFYAFKRLGKQHPKKHDSNLKYAMRQFLGPKNFKGEYVYNKYYGVPQNHEPNYIMPEIERGQSLKDNVTGEQLAIQTDGSIAPARVGAGRPRDPVSGKRKLQPFPSNRHCLTNRVLGEELKLQVHDDIQNKHLSAQEVSQKYGLKIPRVEAAVKLVELEQKWEKYNRIAPSLKSMSSVLYKMFPLFVPRVEVSRENLSEIPVPAKALRSRFMTIAESEPFGPIDAAKALELEPAAETLEKLATLGEHSAHHASRSSAHKEKVIYGELLKGEKSLFKFENKHVGKVGFRYGSGNRDSKKDRKIGFNELGKMVYL
ncbi:mitochondrial 37S ribosomal protein mS45 [Lachancea thermotolerans CBS 6340]|uniref:KLTH0B02266p n=1 Tax=Lachancea thermotolerans (strain ATCC 56472 / CBS 6340 / NRRL Y-8284) TaxID=559295 RepID=C5DCD9_LACTC|nr:mitochondrial 37S ribosomal protein MRPS35 [Lachancea thermotolerans CBS 6340]CAR21450.1 KLTH0B02266p [Lachancea thermotolerans CBS 6340]